MTCPDEQLLVLFADGASDAEVREHLRLCAVCADRVEQVRTALSDWRTGDLCSTSDFDSDYFAALAQDIEQALSQSEPAASPGSGAAPTRWWRNPPSLLAAMAALLLLCVGLLRSQEQPSLLAEDNAAPAEGQRALEEMARELGRSLLSSTSEADDELLDEEATPFLAAWSTLAVDLGEDLPPMPLTTTLADEFDLLDSEQVRSLITRL